MTTSTTVQARRLAEALTLGLAAAWPAPARSAPLPPIDECYTRANSREQIGACLDRLLEEARVELVELVGRTRASMREAGELQKSAEPARRFERSQRLFWSYRRAQCDWVRQSALPAVDAAEQQKDCMVRLTRARNAELRARLPPR